MIGKEDKVGEIPDPRDRVGGAGPFALSLILLYICTDEKANPSQGGGAKL